MKIPTTFSLSIFLIITNLAPVFSQCEVDVGAAGNTSICEGDSLLLEASNGFVSYEWNTEDTTRLIWAVDPGWYLVEAVDDTGCVAKDSILIAVIEVAILEIGIEPEEEICSGDTVVVEASNNFVSYAWSTGDTTRIISFAPVDDLVLVLEAVDSSGCEIREEIEIIIEECSNNSDTCEVEIETDMEEPIICSGDSIILEPTAGFESYSWNTGDSTRIIWALDSGWYVVTAVNDTGCVARDSIFLEIVEAIPLSIESNPDPAEVCVGGEVVLEIPEGFRDIAWNTGDDDRVIDLTLEESRLIVVEALDENGCAARAEIEISVDTSCTATGIDREFQQSPPFLIGPNPTTDLLKLQYTGDTAGKLSLRLMNIKGQQVQKLESLSVYPNQSYQWKLQPHTPGIYIAELRLETKTYRMKLLIQE